jgi:hypothetical protein
MDFKWNFNPVLVTDQDDLKEVIKQVDFELQISNNTRTVRRVTTYGLSPANKNDFILLQNVTNEDFERWITESGSALINSIKQSLVAELNS